MTLGGLSLAVGILVDEATVVIENIHTQMGKTASIARAVLIGTAETMVPNMLAMLCILAVFLPSFLMEGAARSLFVPLAISRRLRHGHRLHPVDHLRAGAVDLAAAACTSTRIITAAISRLPHEASSSWRAASMFTFARFQGRYSVVAVAGC